MIIDSHQHFWNLDRVAYPWLTSDFGPIFRTFEEDDLEPELAACGVERTILVQAMDSVADTEYMFEIACRWNHVAGIVGWVPLDKSDEAAEAVDRFLENPLFVGVRHLIHVEPDPDWLLRPEVDTGLTLLEERGLAFDVVAVLPRHLEHVSVLAERHPSLRLVIDHLAKPPIKEKEWEPWATLIARAASYPNVYAKISGLNTAADFETWCADDLRRYVDHVVHHFGASRLMYGSDWPISILAGGYRKVWGETIKLLDELSSEDQGLILGGTAAFVYRLPSV